MAIEGEVIRRKSRGVVARFLAGASVYELARDRLGRKGGPFERPVEETIRRALQRAFNENAKWRKTLALLEDM